MARSPAPATRAPAEPAPASSVVTTKDGWFNRLYRGEAGLDVVGRRRSLFGVAGAVLLIAIVSFVLRGFTLTIDFAGGNQFQIPASAGTLASTQSTVARAIAAVDPHAAVASAERLGGANPSYLIQTSTLPAEQTATVKTSLESSFHLTATQISDNRVSASWGAQVTQRSLLGLVIFLVLVMLYLIVRFEWRMAVAAVSSLAFDLVFTAAVYSLVGFQVSPSTVIGFLTILGFALYDVVVVFDKIQENARGLTARTTATYGETANLAVNQMLMRSINTGLVALLPVGGLLFIGAGLLGAGTLQDLGLVLFVGMGAAVYSSIFFATPVLATLKQHQPTVRAHTQRVLARRATPRPRREPRNPTPGNPTTEDPTTQDDPGVSSPALAQPGRPRAVTPAPKPRPRGGVSHSNRRRR